MRELRRWFGSARLVGQEGNRGVLGGRPKSRALPSQKPSSRTGVEALPRYQRAGEALRRGRGIGYGSGSVARAESVATTVIAYVEACAAFARRRREGRLSRGDYRRTIQDLQSDWDHSLLLEVPVNSFEGRRIWQRCTLFGPMMRCI